MQIVVIQIGSRIVENSQADCEKCTFQRALAARSSPWYTFPTISAPQQVLSSSLGLSQSRSVLCAGVEHAPEFTGELGLPVTCKSPNH